MIEAIEKNDDDTSYKDALSYSQYDMTKELRVSARRISYEGVVMGPNQEGS